MPSDRFRMVETAALEEDLAAAHAAAVWDHRHGVEIHQAHPRQNGPGHRHGTMVLGSLRPARLGLPAEPVYPYLTFVPVDVAERRHPWAVVRVFGAGEAERAILTLTLTTAEARAHLRRMAVAGTEAVAGDITAERVYARAVLTRLATVSG